MKNEVLSLTQDATLNEAAPHTHVHTSRCDHANSHLVEDGLWRCEDCYALFNF